MSTPVVPTSADGASHAPQVPDHPLEPLTAHEVARGVAILHEQGKVTPTTRFVSVSLKEPPKELVHAPRDRPLPREAHVVLFDNATNSCHEAVLSVSAGTLLAYRHIPGVQPTMTIDEQVECEQAVLQSEEFQAALKKYYDIEDTRLVMVDIWSAGDGDVCQ